MSSLQCCSDISYHHIRMCGRWSAGQSAITVDAFQSYVGAPEIALTTDKCHHPSITQCTDFLTTYNIYP